MNEGKNFHIVEANIVANLRLGKSERRIWEL